MCSVDILYDELFFRCFDAMIFGYEEVKKSAKPGQNKFKQINKIMKEIDEVFMKEKGMKFPFDLRTTRFQVIALQHTSDFRDEKGILGKVAHAAKNVGEKHAASHEYIEIQGKNDCIYTIGLGVIEGNPNSVILINDFAFTACKNKNKACFEEITTNGSYTYDNKHGKVRTINSLQDCNQLCGLMQNMRQSGPNQFTPIGTRNSTYREDAAGIILDIERLKFIRNLFFKASLQYEDGEALLVIPTNVEYDKYHSIKIKSPLVTGVLGKLPKWVGADKVCAKNDSSNCRSFAENFRDNISILMSSFGPYQENIYEKNVWDLALLFPDTYDLVAKSRAEYSEVEEDEDEA